MTKKKKGRRSKREAQKAMAQVLAPFENIATCALLFAEGFGHVEAKAVTALIIDVANAYVMAGGSIPAPDNAFVPMFRAVYERIASVRGFGPEQVEAVVKLVPLVVPGLCSKPVH